MKPLLDSVKSSIHRIFAAAAHLWLSGGECWSEQDLPRTPTIYYVYAHNMEWGRPLLEPDRGPKWRIKITMEIEEW